MTITSGEFSPYKNTIYNVSLTIDRPHDGFEFRLIALDKKRFAAVLLRLSDKKKSIRVCRAGEGDPCLSTAR